MRAPLRIAAAQPGCFARDVRANVGAHVEAIWAAVADLVVFPELSLTGYELDADPVRAAQLAPLVRACADTGSVALVGAPIRECDGRRFIATLRIDGERASVAYRKAHLGGQEPEWSIAGTGPVAIPVRGWRVGLGICRDTGVAEHVAGVAGLGVDAYVAGVTHRPHELPEQDARGARIASACDAPVAFASFAGPTGGGFEETAGTSTIWAADGAVLARAGTEPGAVIRASLR